VRLASFAWCGIDRSRSAEVRRRKNGGALPRRRYLGGLRKRVPEIGIQWAIPRSRDLSNCCRRPRRRVSHFSPTCRPSVAALRPGDNTSAINAPARFRLGPSLRACSTKGVVAGSAPLRSNTPFNVRRCGHNVLRKLSHDCRMATCSGPARNVCPQSRSCSSSLVCSSLGSQPLTSSASITAASARYIW
jgi:hypothetical protein